MERVPLSSLLASLSALMLLSLSLAVAASNRFVDTGPQPRGAPAPCFEYHECHRDWSPGEGAIESLPLVDYRGQPTENSLRSDDHANCGCSVSGELLAQRLSRDVYIY